MQKVRIRTNQSLVNDNIIASIEYEKEIRRVGQVL